MNRKELYKKRAELLIKSKKLKESAIDKNLSYDKIIKLREEQDKTYKKWKFYNEILKATEYDRL